MGRMRAVCISLEPRSVEVLERLARKAGSRSEAIRRLLALSTRLEQHQQVEAAYREYFTDANAVGLEKQLTSDMLQCSQWPEDGRGNLDDRPRKRPAR